MKFRLYSLLIVLTTCLLAADASAQPNEPPQNPPAPVPITGVEYLLLGGGIYGIYRFTKKTNKKDEA